MQVIQILTENATHNLFWRAKAGLMPHTTGQPRNPELSQNPGSAATHTQQDSQEIQNSAKYLGSAA